MQPTDPIRVCHIIGSLDNTGGAQRMLYGLLSRLDPARVQSEVISLVDIGRCGRKIQSLGIPVSSLGMKRGIPNPLALFRLVRKLRAKQPSVVQTWMYHSDLMGGLAAPLAGRPPVIWNIRHSDLDPNVDKKSTLITARLCAMLSTRLPTHIIAKSERGRTCHASLGYDESRMDVLPNGFDLSNFQVSADARARVRAERNIDNDTPLVGLVGRFHPQKDHQTFIRAAQILQHNIPRCEFLLCGNNVTWDNRELADLIARANLRDRFHLLGFRSDVPQIQSALDLAVLSSACGEGFPNTIGEAMACGTPCVVTDVGDAAHLVGETGRVVPIRNPQKMAAACQSLLSLPTEERAFLGKQARERIEQHFDLDEISRRYERLWFEVASRRSSATPQPHRQAA